MPDGLYGTPRCISLATARKELTPEAAAAVETSLAQPGALVRYFAEHPEVRVVIVDFFAYSCTNCLRTIPGLVELHHKYAAHGLGVIAFHRPEFDFEVRVSTFIPDVEPFSPTFVPRVSSTFVLTSPLAVLLTLPHLTLPPRPRLSTWSGLCRSGMSRTLWAWTMTTPLGARCHALDPLSADPHPPLELCQSH